MERYLRQSVLRKIILWFAALFVLSFIVHMVLQGIYNSRQLKEVSKQQEAYYNIVDLVETKPADNSRNEEIAKQAALLGDKANVIVTDTENKVVYSLNRNYMSENETTFTIGRAVDIERGVLPVNPPEGPVMIDGDKRAHVVKPVPGQDEMGARLKDLPGGYLFSKSQIMFQVRSEFIDAKKWNLYVISSDSMVHADQIIVKSVVWFSLMIYWLLLPIWVFRDASRRYNKAALWSLLVLVTNIFGLIAYMSLRQKQLTCTNCEDPILPSYAACPNCGTSCKHACSSCQNPVDPNWSYCAYCSQPLHKEPAVLEAEAH